MPSREHSPLLYETQRLLDLYEPGTLPSRRYSRLVRVGHTELLELRDPNDGQDPDPSAKARYQYARAGTLLWSRRLPPESVGDEEWVDGPARWERVDLSSVSPLLRAYWREGQELPLVVLRRETFYSREDDGAEYCIGGEYVDADVESQLWIACGPCVTSWWDVPLPPCPDCGGELQWWEAGYVPGTRRCAYCGSMFSAGLGKEGDYDD